MWNERSAARATCVDGVAVFGCELQAVGASSKLQPISVRAMAAVVVSRIGGDSMSGLPPEQTGLGGAGGNEPLRIGVDVGGTFTDLVAFDPKDGSLRVVKLPSTPPDFHRAVIEAIERVTGREGHAE